MSVTTVDLDPELLAAAKRALDVPTAKAAITQALEEVVMRRRQADAIAGLAAIDFDENPSKIDYEVNG